MGLFPSRLFGTSGIRGPAATLFSDQFCFDIGRTFAKFLEKNGEFGPVAVGMDPRPSSQRILESFAAGLSFEGREVFDQGIAPIPAINYILMRAPFAGSTMVSGSHIKADLNGLKFFAFKEEISKEHESQIESIYEALAGKVKFTKSDSVPKKDNRAHKFYLEMLERYARGPYPAWRAVIDPGNGAQSPTMPSVFAKLGMETIVINANPQPAKFMARDTETEGEFNELQEKVRKEKADFGVAWDADGDRCVFVDEKGDYIPGDYTGALIAKHQRGDFVVTPINTSSVVDQIGKKVIRTRVGSPYVVAAMKESGASFGFEGNGGGIFREMLSRDGGRTCIEVLNLLKKSTRSLSQLVGQLPKFYLFKTKVEYEWEMREKILAAAKKEFSGQRTSELDGLKIWIGKSTWILFRSSANAPEFRVFTQAKTKVRAEKLAKKGIEFVKKVIAGS